MRAGYSLVARYARNQFGMQVRRISRRRVSVALLVAILASSVVVSPALIKPIAVSAAASYPPVSVFVGYYDNLRTSPFLPNPWQGSTNTNFIGSAVNGIFDSGAIRIDNPSSSTITAGDVSVDIGSNHFDLWGSNMALPANGHLILAQTGATAGQYNFDTSDTSNGTCTNDGLIPQVHVTINGIVTTYPDTRQVLNTGGVDLAGCPAGSNESHQWQLVGGGPTASELRGGGSPSIRHRTACQRGRYPVNCATGEFWHTFADLSVPGRGLALDFTRTYSSLGAAQSGPLGFGWTHSYNLSAAVDSASGNVTITEETGSQVTFTPVPSGYQAPSRVIASLVKNGDGSYTFTRWDREQFLFNAAGQLLQESDRNGYKTTLAYNSIGVLGSVTDPAGRSFTFSYIGALLASVMDPANRKVSFSYDSSGNLVSATDVNGGVTKFTYDPNHLMLVMTDPRGGVATNVYDSSGRVTSQTDPTNRTTSYSYTPTGTTVTDPNGNVEVQQYQNNELTSLTEGSGTSVAATWSYAYDPNSLGVTAVTDPNGHTWSNTYDSTGNLLRSVDPLTRKASYVYDSLNDLTSATDQLGVSTTWTYDGSGNLLSVSRPLTGSSQTQQTSFTYGDGTHPGDVTSLADPNGKVWPFAYDTNGDLTSATDPLADQTTISYDAIGRPTSVVSPKGNVLGANPAAYTTSYGYNAFGDVTTVTDPLGHATSFTYDGNRNRTAVTDPNGHQTTYAYDPDDELTKVGRADGSTLASGYDPDGNLSSQVNGLGNATTYGYNALNRLVSMTDALKRTTSYAYDGAGNLTSLTDPAGQVTSYGYDAANQLTGITYSDGKTPNVTYAYDADGRRTSMTDGTGTSSYGYDSLNRLTQSKNGAGQTVGYSYDLAGRLTVLTYPNAQVVNRGYDAAGRLTSVADWLGHTTTFSYDPNGNLVTEAYPNTTQAAYAYDAADQLTSITDSKSGSTFASFSYGRDANGQLIGETSTGLNQPAQSYSYDQVSRLTGVNGSSYAYDAADNITKLISGASLSYDAANELTSMTRSGVTTTFSYDSRGNRLTGLSPEGTAATYTYDQANRLTGFKTTPPPATALISDGSLFALAARSDGTVWSWGLNSAGQLGNGTTTNSSVPVQATGMVGATDVAAGGVDSWAVRSDGTLWAWGDNTAGELGNGILYGTYTKPVQIPGLANAIAVAAGGGYTLVLKGDGSVVAWGGNSDGQLGNGTTTSSSTPVTAQGLANVTAIAAGASSGTQSLALKSDGTVWAWGNNKNGQLGTGTTTNSSIPVQVTGLANVVAIAAGQNSSYALRNDGTVWAWGDNGHSQLGNSSVGPKSTTPVQVSIGGVVSIGAGGDFAFAIKSDGTAWGWGENSGGQLGDGGVCGKTCVTPDQVNGLSGVVAVTGGEANGMAITSAGAVFDWGANPSGELGNGTTGTGSSTPVQVNNFGAVKQAPASASYTYDGDGLRASKMVSGTTNQFAWDLTGSLPLVLTDGSANNYVYGPAGLPVEQISGTGSILLFHQDQLSSTRLLTDGTGNVAATYSYDPYGNLNTISGSASSRLEYTGEYVDPETGFQYLRARYLDSSTASFVQSDPVFMLNRARYSYATENPLNLSDPTGLYNCGWMPWNCISIPHSPQQAWDQFSANARNPQALAVAAVAGFVVGVGAAACLLGGCEAAIGLVGASAGITRTAFAVRLAIIAGLGLVFKLFFNPGNERGELPGFNVPRLRHMPLVPTPSPTPSSPTYGPPLPSPWPRTSPTYGPPRPSPWPTAVMEVFGYGSTTQSSINPCGQR